MRVDAVLLSLKALCEIYVQNLEKEYFREPSKEDIPILMS